MIGCTFAENTADQAGGALYIGSSTDISITNCVFRENSGGTGGAMYVGRETVLTLVGCTFERNSSTGLAGAIFRGSDGVSSMTNCAFVWNSAVGGAGAMYNGSRSVLTARDCLFWGNAAGGSGGALYNSDSEQILSNCTFSANIASSGGAMFNSSGHPRVTNTVLWGDSPQEMFNVAGSVPVVTFSNVMGGWTGVGNIDEDPRFVDPAADDYHIQPGSPCIDAGDPAFVPEPGETDLDRQMRVWDGDGGGVARVDMGADEHGSYVFGDLNCDAAVDAFDIEPFVLALFDPDGYAQLHPDCEANLADLNADGNIDALDIEPFLDLLFP